MEQNEDKRTGEDRRKANDKRSEKFIKYFIPEEEEKRVNENRRKSESEWSSVPELKNLLDLDSWFC